MMIDEKCFILDCEIEIGRVAIGDLIVLSNLPELIKLDKSKKWTKVYVRKLNFLDEHKSWFFNKLFLNNPFIDGFIDCDRTDRLGSYETIYPYLISHFDSYNILACYSHFLKLDLDYSDSNLFRPKFYFDLDVINSYSNLSILDLNSRTTNGCVQSYLPGGYESFINDIKTTILGDMNMKLDYQLNLKFLNLEEHFLPPVVPNVPILDVFTPCDYLDILNSSKTSVVSFSGNSVILSCLNKPFVSIGYLYDFNNRSPIAPPTYSKYIFNSQFSNYLFRTVKL